MSQRFPSVEKKLNRAAAFWKGMRLLQYTADIGAIACAFALLLGTAMLSGRLVEKNSVIGLCVLITIIVLGTWAVITLKVMTEKTDRSWLAFILEQANRKLLDRLNTLVFLEKTGDHEQARSFAPRIARQTRNLLSTRSAPLPISRMRTIIHLLIFAAFFSSTLFVYQHYTPWQKLLDAQRQRNDAAEKAKEEKALAELAPPETNLLETNRAWGEIRITDPGRDMQATKLQVVSLQIEAAASEPLRRITWKSAINDGPEQVHELPPSEDPRYAAYKPEIDLFKLGLSEWDVMTYYAKAECASNHTYISEVYFLEVRPSHEEIEQSPGSKGGSNGYHFLSQLTEFIRRQQHVIRETYRHVQDSQSPADMHAQDQNKLADAESDLSDSIKHLGAEMAAGIGADRISGVLEDLAQAEKPIFQASGSLRTNFVDDAQKQERDGLQHLIATRKHFQKIASESPSEFSNEPDSTNESSASKNDLSSTNKLNQITEFRNEAKAAQEFLDKATQQQRDIARRTDSRAINPKLAQEESQLQLSLNRFQSEHPSLLRNVGKEFEEAKQSLGTAADALQKRNRDSQAKTQQAADKLDHLSQAVKSRAEAQQLADAYKLKQMLDRQIQALGQCEQSGGELSSSDATKLANAGKATLNQLKDIAEQSPTRDAFAPPLRDALSPGNRSELDSRLNQFASAENNEMRKQAAGKAKEGLQKVSKAFEQSQPESLKAAEKNDPLKPSPQDYAQQGLSQLKHLMDRLQNQPSMSSQDQMREGSEALANLRNGFGDAIGSNEKLREVFAQVEEKLKKPEPSLDPSDFEKLLRELQRLASESAERLEAKLEKPKVTEIDAERLPPAYRTRIEKYFKKLSER